jgi:hypothetical protein
MQRLVKGVISPPLFGRQQMCSHEGAVPVELLDCGEVVAHLCTTCDAQLAADWRPGAAFCPYGELPSFPPVYDLPPFVPDPRLTGRICE